MNTNLTELREVTVDELNAVEGGWFMFAYSQTATLASNVQKKDDDTTAGIIRNF